MARKFEERRVDGIIVTASRVGAQYVPLLTHMQVPIVLLNNQHPSQFAHSVMIANVQASLDATRHLIALGHRRIAYLGDRYGHQSDTERSSGYRQALRGSRTAFRARAGGARRRQAGRSRDRNGRAARLAKATHGRLLLQRYVGTGRDAADPRPRPADSRRTFPWSGFDDLYISQYLDPPLTTVRQPMRQMGRMAMETLLQDIRWGRIGARYQSPRGIDCAPVHRTTKGEPMSELLIHPEKFT